MDKNKQFISPAIFGLIIICFFLPFVSVSFFGVKSSASGFSIAFRGGSFFGILTLLLAIGGVALYFWNDFRKTMVGAVIGAAGFITTILIRVTNPSVSKSSSNLFGDMVDLSVGVSYSIGFYLILILFVLAAVYHYLVLKNSVDQVLSRMSQVMNQAESKIKNKMDSGAVACPKCGFKNQPGVKFCSQCGGPLDNGAPQNK